ncbi:hypothetical protein SAMN05216241_11320 [Limimonas halophila]|uniref:YgjP-like metallopeptidase domain-containing protein n=1 Tax=Limimonas halophila TaxID=1082479 RepID=A0A1G7UCJ1_9PROT|nr:SprT family zinc-dependent metalloprotease [Limimonas halophila]SDG44470.1 hypothetical protein SAMN05216241_11320 [Limimonas halophila]
MTREVHQLDLGDRTVPLLVASHPNAKRIGLRVDRGDGRVRVTIPRGARVADGLRFAKARTAWLRRHLDAIPETVPLVDGTRVPVLGREHVIRHEPDGRFGVRREDGVLRVSGAADHVPRRVTDHLKREARAAIRPQVQAYAARIGHTPGRISVRDTRSRWGSCSARGELSFSWRLVLAPEPVLTYLVVHEVAHLRHRDHGPGFWSLVRGLMPEADAQRRWLRENGSRLFAYR